MGGGTTVLPTYNHYWSVRAADLNGDGKLDIAASYSIMSGPPPHAGKVAVYFQNATKPGSFLSPMTYGVDNDPAAIAVGDLNGDGKLDLVTANTILNADGVGNSTVSALLQDAVNPGQFLPAVNYATGFSPTDVAVGDLNGDGLNDLAVADRTGISILLQNSSARGQFLPMATIAVGKGTSGVAIADLNGHGLADLTATATGVNVYLQNPDARGTFLGPVTYAAGAQPYWLVATDLNADGRADIATANLGSSDGKVGPSVSVLLQNATSKGMFQPVTNYASDTRSWTIAAADLDGDGRVDLVSGNMGSFTGGSVSVLLQKTSGAGIFQPPVNYAESGTVGGVAIGDVDGDGRPDLIVASTKLEVRLQDAAHPGAFLAAVSLSEP